MAECTVFYSWQSDLPNGTNRTFIGDALEKAVKAIQHDGSIAVEPVVDRDTIGVPGSPDISRTILAKIDRAAVFVGDVSIINSGSTGRLTPNPNVMIELGYALSRLGEGQIIMVMNTAFGGPETLPFDLKIKRVTQFDMPLEAEERATERKKLEKVFTEALATIFRQIENEPQEAPSPSLADLAVAAVRQQRPDQNNVTRRFVQTLPDRIASLVPNDIQGGEAGQEEALLKAIDQSVELVSEFARLSEAVAAMDASEVAEIIDESFGPIHQHYNQIYNQYPGKDIVVNSLFQFVGHELFVTLFAFLVAERRWRIVAALLAERLRIANLLHGTQLTMSYEWLSDDVSLLKHRAWRLHQHESQRLELLRLRHIKDGPLGSVPLLYLRDADYFLFLRSALQADDTREKKEGWIPWSAMFMRNQTPSYLLDADRKDKALRLAEACGFADTETFKARLVERSRQLQLYASVDVQTIGIR